MKSNKEKFLSLVSKENANTVEKNRECIKNRQVLRIRKAIILKKLDENTNSERVRTGVSSVD